MDAETIGTPARDGQDDPPPACSVCRSAETDAETRTVVRSQHTRVPDARGANRHRLVCMSCLEAALKSVGAGTQDLHTRTCVGRHRDDDTTRYEVAAAWPLQSYTRGPHWLACVRHLGEALDAIAAERNPE